MCSFWQLVINACGQELSCRKIGPLLLTNAGWLRVNFWCISLISLQYFSFVMVSSGFVKLWWIKSAEDHQSVTVTFFWMSFGFEKCCGALLASNDLQALNVYDWRTESAFHQKVQFDREKDYLACEVRRAEEISKLLRLRFKFNSWGSHFSIFCNSANQF